MKTAPEISSTAAIITACSIVKASDPTDVPNCMYHQFHFVQQCMNVPNILSPPILSLTSVSSDSVLLTHCSVVESGLLPEQQNAEPGSKLELIIISFDRACLSDQLIKLESQHRENQT